MMSRPFRIGSAGEGFVKLTQIPAGEAHVHFSSINLLEVPEGVDWTKVWLDTNVTLIVRETPEDIKEAISRAALAFGNVRVSFEEKRVHKDPKPTEGE